MQTGVGPGDVIAGYEVERLIARGGMATVYRARDLRLDRWVALKVLAPELTQNQRFRQRFMQESQLAASLDHPHIVPIFEAGEAGDVLYLAMRLVDGVDLKTLLRGEGPLPLSRMVALLRQVAGALDAAHEHGLVHRDVKPANILVTSGRGEDDPEHVYLGDFGLTKRAASLTGLTEAGHFIGTVDYIAPEQILGQPVSARTDVYALGCVAYESLTGRAVFDRDNDAAVIYAHLHEPPPLVTAARADLPPELDLVVGAAMAKDPNHRQASCRRLIVDLQGAGTPTQVGAPTLPTPRTATPVPAVTTPRSSHHASGAATGSSAVLGRPGPAAAVSRGAPDPGFGVRQPAQRRRRRRGIGLLVLLALLLLATGGVSLVLVTQGDGGPWPVSLPFSPEVYDNSLLVTRTWTLDGRGDRLHGQLSVRALTQTGSPVNVDEVIPKGVTASASQVVSVPRAKTMQDDPVIRYVWDSSGQPGSTILGSYDIPVPKGPATQGRLQQWAQEQAAEAEDYYREHGGAPLRLRDLQLKPNALTLRVGSAPELLTPTGHDTTGRLLNGYDSDATRRALFEGVTYVSTDPRIARVSETPGEATAEVIPVAPGQTTVTAQLGQHVATVSVSVAQTPAQSSAIVPPSDPASPRTAQTGWTGSAGPTGPTTVPTAPTGPTGPTTVPTAPTGPTGPTTAPTAPTTVTVPTGPMGPTTAPTGPTGPTTAPTGPTMMPTVPTGPAGPSGSAGPRGPAGPP